MIKSVQFASNKNASVKNNIEIAQPAKDRGSITIICGKNHSGKTYISKRIHRSINQRNLEINKNPNVNLLRHGVDNIYTEYNEGNNLISSILITRIANVTDLMKSVSVVSENNHKSRKHLQKSDNYDRIQIKEGLENFCFDCVDNYFMSQGKNLDRDSWFIPDNIEYRKHWLNLIGENALYLTPRYNSVIAVFETLTSGKLYFGVNQRDTSIGEIPEFELRLVFDNDIIIPLGGWSEGQKVLFSLLTLIHYIRPQILIFDEIENHLHPEFISSLLEFLKKNVQQTIITTHHPHIIFSKHVDRVNYLEFSKSSDGLPNIIEKKRSEKMKSLSQTNALLDKNYSKILSAYKLFDSYDNQLLRLSSSNISDLNDLLVEIFTSLFTYEIISPKKSAKPDLQSQKLYEIFEKKLQEKDLEILEFGAGEGRLLIDIDKILKTPEKDRIIWHLYEPYEEARIQLQSNLENHKYKDRIQVYSERPVKKFDFIIIANVLHELTAKTIANILFYCSKSLKSDGCILIVELFPLLKPEQYAVPLRSTEWTALARKIGFNATSNGINFRNAFYEAYFTRLSLPTKGLKHDENEIEKIIREFWIKEVLNERILDYSGHLKLGDSDEIPLTLGNLCTIASIFAYNNRSWET